MAEQDGKRELVRSPQVTPPLQVQDTRKLRLGAQEELDLSNLGTVEQRAIEAKFLEKAIERDDRRQRLKDDLTATAAQLDQFTRAVGDATANNAAATITNAKEDSYGRTEMILGNSDAAKTGKLSRSQQGLSDNARFWTLLAIIAGVVIVLVAALRR